MDSAAQIGRLIGPLRRAVLRTRHAEGLPDLPEAQIEVLRLLEEFGASPPHEVAEQLRMAPSTVSNLIRTMSASGLVERTPSVTDLRTVYLTLSPTAHDMLVRYDRTSTAALRRAIARLSSTNERALTRALPALAELIIALADDESAEPSACEIDPDEEGPL